MRNLFERYPWFTASTVLAFAAVWLHVLTVSPWWMWVPVSWVSFHMMITVLAVAKIVADMNTTDAGPRGNERSEG